MPALMGIDIGTGSVKVELSDQDGRRWTASSEPYPIDSSRRGWAEQDPQTWWQATKVAASRVWEQAGLPATTEVSVGFTGQMHTSLLLDDDNHPMRPAILWCDNRAQAQARALAERMPDLARIAGTAPLAAFSLSHLLWMQEHEPAQLRRARRLVQPKDYIRMLLTGQWATDWTDASGTNMLDVASRTWAEPILATTEIPEHLLPPVLAPHQIVGPAPDLLPGNPNTLAVIGLGDVAAEALSAGAIDPGPLVVTLGTSGGLYDAQTAPRAGVLCHATPDRWVRVDSLHAAGRSLTWLRDVIAPEMSLTELTEQARAVPAGAEGLLFLPFLSGDRSADGGSARGGFLGTEPRHGRAHLVRAVLEGVAMELKRIAVVRLGIEHPSSVVLKGGGAKDPLWAQIVAAVFDAPTTVSARSAASGALDVAGVGAGWWTYEQAAARAVQGPQQPSAALVSAYAEHFRAYVDTVHTVMGIPPLPQT